VVNTLLENANTVVVLDFETTGLSPNYGDRAIEILDSEFKRINREYTGHFCCSMLVARRIYQDAPNHKLETLISFKNINPTGNFHRALADAEMTAHLWTSMIDEICDNYSIPSISFKNVKRLSKTGKASTDRFLCSLSES